jgi:hypothetical protein
MVKESTLADLIRVNDNPVKNFVEILRHRKACQECGSLI